jgi:PqqD family protein of HPr-rel-A system
MQRAVVWKVEGESRFHFRRWGDECVAYDNATGDTHLLDPVAAELLVSLQQAAATTEELVQRVASRLGTEAGSDLFSALESALGDFERLAFIRRAER